MQTTDLFLLTIIQRTFQSRILILFYSALYLQLVKQKWQLEMIQRCAGINNRRTLRTRKMLPSEQHHNKYNMQKKV